jgi:hypothetical protein
MAIALAFLTSTLPLPTVDKGMSGGERYEGRVEESERGQQ